MAIEGLLDFEESTSPSSSCASSWMVSFLSLSDAIWLSSGSMTSNVVDVELLQEKLGIVDELDRLDML